MSIFVEATYQLTINGISQFVEPWYIHVHLNLEGLVRDRLPTVLTFIFSSSRFLPQRTYLLTPWCTVLLENL